MRVGGSTASAISIPRPLLRVCVCRGARRRCAVPGTLLRAPAAFGSPASRTFSLKPTALNRQDLPCRFALSTLNSARRNPHSASPGFDAAHGTGEPATGLGIPGPYRMLPRVLSGRQTDGRASPGGGLQPGLCQSRASAGEWRLGRRASTSMQTAIREHARPVLPDRMLPDMIGTFRSLQRDRGDDWTPEITGTLARGVPSCESSAIDQAAPCSAGWHPGNATLARPATARRNRLGHVPGGNGMARERAQAP